MQPSDRKTPILELSIWCRDLNSPFLPAAWLRGVATTKYLVIFLLRTPRHPSATPPCYDSFMLLPLTCCQSLSEYSDVFLIYPGRGGRYPPRRSSAKTVRPAIAAGFPMASPLPQHDSGVMTIYSLPSTRFHKPNVIQGRLSRRLRPWSTLSPRPTLLSFKRRQPAPAQPGSWRRLKSRKAL